MHVASKRRRAGDGDAVADVARRAELRRHRVLRDRSLHPAPCAASSMRCRAMTSTRRRGRGAWRDLETHQPGPRLAGGMPSMPSRDRPTPAARLPRTSSTIARGARGAIITVAPTDGILTRRHSPDAGHIVSLRAPGATYARAQGINGARHATHLFNACRHFRIAPGLVGAVNRRRCARRSLRRYHVHAVVVDAIAAPRADDGHYHGAAGPTDDRLRGSAGDAQHHGDTGRLLLPDGALAAQ